MTKTLDQVVSIADKLFTKPGLRERVVKVQKMYLEPNADGYQLTGLLKSALDEQGEYDFEQEILPYPVVVELPPKHFELGTHRGKGGDPSPLFGLAEEWLKAHVPADEYLAFPGSACGQYKKCCFNVYFKTHQWATYFKVGFTY
jgi:hypothetical protein